MVKSISAMLGLPVPSRLFWKIFGSLWLAIAAIAFCVDFVVDAMFQSELRQSPDLSIGYRAELATTLVATTLHHADVEGTRQLFMEWSGKRELPVLVVNARGEDILARTVPAPALAQAVAMINQDSAERSVQRVLTPSGEAYVLFVPLLLLPASAPHQHVYRYAESTRAEVLAMALVSLLFAAGLTWYLYRPIRHLHDANRRFAAGDLDTRVGQLIGDRRDEIADLGRDFDDMAGRVQSTIEAKSRLLHDVSHELRSPLARMQIALELTRQTPAKTGEMLERIAYEIDRLDKMLGETLTLSRLKSRSERPGEECFNLVELLVDIVEDARFETASNSRQIEFLAHDDVLITGRSELLRSAIENVIRNAIVHTLDGAAVIVDLSSATPGFVTIRVCDGGAGVPDEELGALFEPFFRGRNGEKAQGYGLGLSIARHAVEAHGGQVCASNIVGGGLCVSLILPVTTLDE
ncbi:MAG: two-component sensor histidine kinase [Betaproteobacteria bacterium HGW-Betaproteobacteria-6]|nr:MAG: two-component sensor histidine kinase [Betaproteobacteria bacterium HGW-Betaproteobacteria-6]